MGSEDRNAKIGVTHIAHQQTLQGTTDKSFLSLIHFTRQGEKVNRNCHTEFLHIKEETT